MTAPWPVVMLIALLGLAIGSFLNVVIYRVPRGESVVHPGSHCPRCDTAIKARHNVPVLGWLVLRGRCHACALPISVRYPLVEAATGLGMTAVVHTVGLTPLLAPALLAVPVAITITMIAVDASHAHPRTTTVTTDLDPTALSAPHRRSS